MAAATELLLPLTVIWEVRVGLEVAAPVSPLLPPLPLAALLDTVGLALAWPVLPELPLALALAPLLLPLVALPLASAEPLPEPDSTPVPEMAFTLEVIEALPEPAAALPSEVELPLLALISTSTSLSTSPESPPSPESPLVTSGSELTSPEQVACSLSGFPLRNPPVAQPLLTSPEEPAMAVAPPIIR